MLVTPVAAARVGLVPLQHVLSVGGGGGEVLRALELRGRDGRSGSVYKCVRLKIV